MKHEAKIIYDDRPLVRPWGIWCETCGHILGACTNEQEAKELLAWHERITSRATGSEA